jgi:DNA-binding protein H-NS
MEVRMKNMNLEAMPLDELWALHEQIGSILTPKIAAEKRELERRLDELGRKFGSSSDEPRLRRPYPKVHPKFRNPEQPSETWAGRGKQPRWVSQLLKAGKSIDDLRIPNA